MADHPRWLKNYYGSYMSDLHPHVVLDGKHKAVVRIMSGGKIAYVLIRKRGRHDSTAHKAVFSGIPTVEELEKMQAQLDAEDKP